MLNRFILVLVLSRAPTAFSQVYTVETIAGSGSTGLLGGGFSGDGGSATSSMLSQPMGVAWDGSNNTVIVADTGNGRIRRVLGDGTITSFNVRITRPQAPAVDSLGNIYIDESRFDGIVRITPSGQAATIAGYNLPAGLQIGSLESSPCLIAIDGGLLICSSRGIHRLTFPDRVAFIADQSDIYGLALDSTGNLFFSMSAAGLVRRIDPTGAITTLPKLTNAEQDQFLSPRGLAVDLQGNVVVALAGSHRVVRISPGGAVTTIAGTGTAGFSGDGGSAALAQFSSPTGVAIDRTGNLYIADTNNHRIRKLIPSGGPNPNPTGPPPAITFNGFVHGATFSDRVVAPGQVISIFGTNLGPATPVGLEVSGGLVTTTLAGARVIFDGTPAPLIAVSAGQINAIAPYSIDGRSTTQVAVEYLGQRSNIVSLSVSATAPGLFSANASGRGQAAVLNQDGTVNSASNPATRGSIAVLFGTGEGQTTPAGVDGKVNNGTPLPRPRLAVTASVGSQPAEVIYAGAAPGLVSGVIQVNIRIPANAGTGNQLVGIGIGPSGVGGGCSAQVPGGNPNNPGCVTIAVR